MNIQFCDTKDGFKTFSLDNVFFHSKYAPLKEAERFVQGITLPYNPKLIFLVEPGLTYCYPFLKDKFPSSKIVIIRLIDYDFPGKEIFDNVIKYDSTRNFKNELLHTFGEEALLSSGIFIWPAAQNVFAEQVHSIIEDYRQTLEECKTLLVTRQFFEKKWLTNCCNFVLNIGKQISLNDKIDAPVVVCASGPSLYPCLEAIKENEDKLFIIALSSALSVLIYNNIKPDLVLSTDGGFWAGEHLKLLAKNSDIPLACPAEAYIPKKILKSNPVLPLEYNDTSSFISTQLLGKAGIPCHKALRNPTVSGTALYFADSITDNKIYFCGLDLHGQPGLQHSKPNEIEKNNCAAETHFANKETRNSRSRFNSASLKIYEEWFAGITDKAILAKTVRVIDEEYKNNTLGKICEIDSRGFADELKKAAVHDLDKKSLFSYGQAELSGELKKEVFDLILEQLDSPKWQNQIFPADFVALQNSGNEEIKQQLSKKIERLKDKIRKLQNG
ncbi:MAG: motility associated factor glycosyltransferase family protein [Treponema sp.]|nr:motility associated factor glycosyltransferase family protein [Treponema sp.]